MSRAIVVALEDPQAKQALPELAEQTAGGGGPPAEKPDTYKERLYKYIPAEVVALYLAVSAILDKDASVPGWFYWIIFLICLVGTPLYLRKAQDVYSRTQLTISTLAFAVWAFALGGPFKTLPWYSETYGAVLLPIFTFFIPLISPKAPKKIE